MKVDHLANYKDGWYVGKFLPSIYSTSDFEVGLKQYSAGAKPRPHYHQHSREINLIIKGKLKYQDLVLGPSFLFVIEPGEPFGCEMLEDTEIVVVKVPSVPGDKHFVQER